jgi:hypothetical protein
MGKRPADKPSLKPTTTQLTLMMSRDAATAFVKLMESGALTDLGVGDATIISQDSERVNESAWSEHVKTGRGAKPRDRR